MIDLKNKNILVTGASRGIGKAIAKELGKYGASIAIHYNKNKESAEALAFEIGNNSFTVQADLKNAKSVLECFKTVLERFGRLDVMINNAGIAILSAIDMEDEKWINEFDQTVNVNLRATSLFCKKSIEHFLNKHLPGIIINIASRAAYRGDVAEYMTYAASKGAVVSMTKSIARAFGNENITAFTVSPGFVRTDMAQEFIDEFGEEPVINNLALNELTEPQDIANVVTFLASGKAKHATGTNIDVNAGSYVH